MEIPDRKCVNSRIVDWSGRLLRRGAKIEKSMCVTHSKRIEEMYLFKRYMHRGFYVPPVTAAAANSSD